MTVLNNVNNKKCQKMQKMQRAFLSAFVVRSIYSSGLSAHKKKCKYIPNNIIQTLEEELVEAKKKTNITTK